MLEKIHLLDSTILTFIQDNLHTPAGDVFFVRVTQLGNHGLIWLVLAVFLFAFKKTRPISVSIVVSVALSFVFGELLLKALFERPRPFSAVPDIRLLIPTPLDYSFPSGHTSSSFAAAFSIFRYKKSWGLPALVIAGLIAFSRMYLFVHYPTDIAAGLLLGIAMGFAAIPIVRPLLRAIEKIWTPETK